MWPEEQEGNKFVKMQNPAAANSALVTEMPQKKEHLDSSEEKLTVSEAGDGGEALQDTELCCHAFPTCCSLHLAPFAVKGTTTKQAKKLPAGHFFSFSFLSIFPQQLLSRTDR